MRLDEGNVAITKHKIDHDDRIEIMQIAMVLWKQVSLEVDNIKWGNSQWKGYLLNTLSFLRLQRKKSYAGDLGTNLYSSFLGGNMWQ